MSINSNHCRPIRIFWRHNLRCLAFPQLIIVSPSVRPHQCTVVSTRSSIWTERGIAVGKSGEVYVTQLSGVVQKFVRKGNVAKRLINELL